MAEYKAIHGTLFQHKTSDPLGTGIPNAAWASGGNMNTARQYVGAFGSQTAGLVAGGETSTSVNNVEQYDGTSWTEIAEINTTRYGLEGFGNSYTSGFVVGGAPDKAETESWNGTSWTEVGDLPQGTERGGCAGTSTSAFYVGGYKYPSPAAPTNVGYDWDGSSWGTGNNINTTRDRMGAAGVVTSGIVFGGTSPGGQHAQAELYNGSAWTETGDLNTARRELGASGFDRTNAQALGFGGEPPAVAHTESFDGSAWTEVANLSTARAAGGGLGTSPLAAFAGGSGLSAATEEFTAAQITDAIKTDGQTFYRSDTGDFKVTLTQYGTGAWASGGNMNNAREQLAGAGTQTSALAAGGAPPNSLDYTETYNGTSWSETAELNVARRFTVGAGSSSTAALFIGGYYDPGPAYYSDLVESWNGSAWTEIAELNTGRATYQGGSGTQTAALTFGGNVPSNVAICEKWDGSSWTEVGDLNTAGYARCGFGSSTSALCFGGNAVIASNEKWDGTSWTEVGDLNTARNYLGGSGTDSTAGLAMGGGTPSANVAITESWNGSSWTEVADLSTGRAQNAPGTQGTSLLSITFGGYTGTAPSNATEEWTVPESISNLTITD